MWFLSSRKIRCAQAARRVRLSRKPRLEVLEDRCLLSGPGSLDPTFASGGIATVSYEKSVTVNAGLLQPNGDIVAVGQFVTKNGQGVFGLARYTPTGSLDPTFGSGGKVTTAFGKTKTNAGAVSATLYPNGGTANDGKIVAGGTGYLVRYNANGSVDQTFGSKGVVTYPSGFSLGDIVIDPSSGDIVLGGSSSDAPPQFELLRFTPNGVLDTTFGQGGEVITKPTPYDDEINSVVVLSNGNILAGGYVHTIVPQTGYYVTENALARYTSAGVLDSTFGSGGLVTTPWVSTTVNTGQEPAGSPEDSRINALALQSDGKVVAAGAASVLNDPAAGYKWGLARYNADGSLDTTFGSGGVVVTQIGNGTIGVLSVTLQRNGEVVAAGLSGLSTPCAVATYTAAGALDPTFGGSGIVTTNLGGQSVLIQPADGKVVVVGTTNIARYIGTTTGPQIGSFTANPNPAASGSNTTLTASNIADTDPGATITQVTFYYYDSNGNKVTLGSGTQTTPGVWTLNFTANLTTGTYVVYAQAEDSYGVFGEQFGVTLTVQ